jgi:hypothetical protein
MKKIKVLIDFTGRPIPQKIVFIETSLINSPAILLFQAQTLP